VVTENKGYERLAERIGAGGYASYIRLLENQLSEEEAQTLVDLEDGMSLADLAKKLKLDEKATTAKIEDLLSRRVILKSKTGYIIPRSPRFFPQGPNNAKTRQLRTDFFRSGDYQKILVDGWKVRLKNGGRQSHKVIPAHKALLASANLDKNLILWYEDMAAIFNRADKRWQGGLKEDGTLGKREEGGCGCRSVWTDACDYAGGCTGWEWKKGEWGDDETAKNEATRPFRPGRREISVEEALKACYEMEDAGQIHISPNTAQITSTCNCCPCCCVIMQPMKNYGNVYEMLAPSRFRAVVDETKCTGCQTCVERCHFDAIEMRKAPGSKKLKSFILNEHCMGCGLCIFKCPSQAMHLELIRPPAHIPTTPWMSPSTAAGAKSSAAPK
jgi:Pyruvate/2-oxoacid:ferredoxin oxidoreductase delta subunit